MGKCVVCIGGLTPAWCPRKRPSLEHVAEFTPRSAASQAEVGTGGREHHRCEMVRGRLVADDLSGGLQLEDAQLPEQTCKIGELPGLGDLAFRNSIKVDPIDLDGIARRGGS